jgi:hypothetical protein
MGRTNNRFQRAYQVESAQHKEPTRLGVSITVPSQVAYKVPVPWELMVSPNPGWPEAKIEVWPRETQLLADYDAMVVSSLDKHE